MCFGNQSRSKKITAAIQLLMLQRTLWALQKKTFLLLNTSKHIVLEDMAVRALLKILGAHSNRYTVMKKMPKSVKNLHDVSISAELSTRKVKNP